MELKVRTIADRRSLMAAVVAVIGLLQFWICLTMAIAVFPDSYSFFTNFLSDLGRSNLPSAVYFNRGIIGLSLCLMLFFTDMVRTQRVSGICGVVSSVGLMGIGLTPLNEAFLEHHIALVFWLGPMLIMMAAVFFESLLNKRFVAAKCSLCALIAGGFYMGSAMSKSAPFAQKVVVGLAFMWLLLVLWHSVFGITREVKSRMRMGDDRATQLYLSHLKKHGLASRDGHRTGRGLDSPQ